MESTSKMASNLCEMIRLKTINNKNVGETDWAVFDSFKKLIEKLYPSVHSTCERTFHGETGILFKWPGKNPNTQVTVLMSHYDVVPADDTLWSLDPFGGALIDDYIWGRGTLDTKGTLCGILEAAEEMISNGFKPEYDIYFSFSGDEEVGGPSAPAIVAYFKSKGITPHIVIDEGGGIVDGKMFGFNGPIALIGTGEKGYLELDLFLTGPGGHASAPPAHSLIGLLADAIVKIEKKPIRAKLTAPTKEMLEIFAEHSKGLNKFLLSNLWLTWPAVKWVFTKKGGNLNAFIRTTTALTKMSGSDAYNVLPPLATVGINFRLIEGDTIQSVIDHTLTAASNKNIDYRVVKKWEASKITSTSHEGWRRVKSVITENWPSVAVSPYLLNSGTDSRHFCSICDCVLRFSPFMATEEQIKSVHGHDEKISVKQLSECVSFYKRVMTVS